MIRLATIEEQSFGKLTDLRDAIAGQDRQVYEAPLKKISLSEDGILRAGRFKGPLAESGLRGLLHTEGAPADFVMYRCPADLSVSITLRLAREKNTSIAIQVTNGVATGIMPADRRPIRHDMLVDRLGIDRPIKEAVLGTGRLRITADSHESKELLPNDTFGFGWEVVSDENGWGSTEVWRWAVRQICTNGLVGFDKDPVFKRRCNDRQPVLVSLQELLHVLENEMQPPVLEPSLRWATDNRIGREEKLVVNYLARRLLGDATRTELNGMGISTTWYDLMNTLTSAARVHSLEVRRRYEAEGGAFLNWFSRLGRGRPPWHRVSCDDCEYLILDKSENGNRRKIQESKS